jgi:hypothetical protein
MNHWRRRLITTVLVLALSTTISIVIVGRASPALAGFNGQQLDAVTNSAWSVEVKGSNQDGVPQDVCFSLPGVDNPINGWWWVGRVVLIFYASSDCSGNDITARSLVVPQVQFGSDYTVVDIRPQ